MELYQLKSFIEVARHQNLTHAARHLHISQSALSAQIKALEAELGVSLFVRSAKGMRPTKEGCIILEKARAIVGAAAEIKHEARQMRRILTGELRIGLNASPRSLRMNQLNDALSEAMPKVNIRFMPSSSLQAVEMLRQQSLDMGFIFGDHAADGIDVQPIASIKIVVVIPLDMTRSRQDPDWPDIAAMPWIWADDGYPCHRAFQDKLDRYGLRLNKTHVAAAESIISELVKGGQGVGLLPEADAMEIQRQGDAVIWSKGAVTVPLSLLCLKNRRKESPIRIAGDVISKVWDKDKAKQ